MRTLLLMTALAVGASPAAAADPTVAVRVRSVNDLAGYLEYLGGIGGQADAGKQAAGFVAAVTDAKKGIEGFDPARPVGLYGVMTPDVIGSYAVLVLPVADPDAVLDFVKGKLALDPRKGDDGVYELAVPNVPVPVFFKFAEKSVYVTARAETVATALAAKNLVALADLFAGKDDALATARVRLDRLPKDVREMVVTQFELQMAQRKDEKAPGETPAQHELKGVLLDAATDALASLLNDGKELTARVVVDPKSDELAAELTLSGKPGTPLAKTLAAADGQKGVASLLPTKNAVMTGGVRFDLPAGLKAKLNPVIDHVLAEAVDKAEESKKDLAAKLVAAVAPTLKAGVVDLGITLLTTEGGKLAMGFALGVADGRQFDQVLREVNAAVPEDRKLKIDAAKAEGLSVHRIRAANPGIDKLTGSEYAWVASGNRLLVATFEPEPILLKAVAQATPAAVPVASLEAPAARMFPLSEAGNLPPEQLRQLVAEAFPDGVSPGADTFGLRITGGDSLTMSLKFKGKALRLAVLVDQAKKAR